MFVVAIKADSETEKFGKPPEYLIELEENAASGTRCRLTRNFLDARFYKTQSEARVGLHKVLGIIPTTNEKGVPWPHGFHVRTGLHLTFDSPERSGEVGIYPVITDGGKVVIGTAVEMSYVEAKLTEVSPFKASLKVDGAFHYTFTGATRPKAMGVSAKGQMELFVPALDRFLQELDSASPVVAVELV